jgi:thioredoxin-like negative regulator of GroEL
MKSLASLIPGLIFILLIAAGLRHIFGLVRGAVTGEGIRGLVLWQSDWNDALAEGVAQHKGVLVEFARESSPNCHELAKKGWSRMDIATAATDYVPVLVDIDEHPELAKQFDIAIVPSLVVIDAKSQTIIRDGRDSNFTPDELLAWLKPGSQRNWNFATPQDSSNLQANPLFSAEKNQFAP